MWRRTSCVRRLKIRHQVRSKRFQLPGSLPITPEGSSWLQLWLAFGRTLGGPLEQRDLPLVIGVVLKKPANHGSYGQARSERRIALVTDPAQQIVGLECIDGALE